MIAFSIWGSNPRYLRGALRNALLIPDLYPGWQARFHLDTTVPLEFRELLQSLGAELRLMPAGQSMRQKLCWRFLVANDPAVGRFLVRDCDSVVNQREVAAVQQWLASERWFHVMRDWWSHTDPILAGMWGGVAGVLPDLTALLSAYRPPAKETANVDQWFLRDLLWGSIRPLALVHDRCFRSEGSVPWPDPEPVGNRHVGQNEFGAQREGQSLWLAGWLQRYPCLQVEGEDPFALIPTSQEPPEDLVLVRWHKPLVVDPKPAMPQTITGWIMNLDRATHRWACMAHQLETLGWVSTHQRFAAKEATMDEAKAVGLPSAGYLGLWRTTISLLEEWLADQASLNNFLHLVEDDAVLNPSLPLAIEPLKSHQGMIDIVFTESFLTVPLYQRFRSLDKQRQHANGGIMGTSKNTTSPCVEATIAYNLDS
ncbi:hypothetical protein [Synechococcus sp. CBW1108]|uniref:hypothetical protein n=1 Tax=Synechococcus sp. CBW1108 TaxID=1353147 RepID=UPI001E59C345|nr:hypothetical protein [Synechococcus sp. CBW1108]